MKLPVGCSYQAGLDIDRGQRGSFWLESPFVLISQHSPLLAWLVTELILYSSSFLEASGNKWLGIVLIFDLGFQDLALVSPFLQRTVQDAADKPVTQNTARSRQVWG